MEKVINILNATWRPFIGWTLAISFFIFFVVRPLIELFSGHQVTITNETSELVSLLVGGGVMAGLRTIEKKLNINNVH